METSKKYGLLVTAARLTAWTLGVSFDLKSFFFCETFVFFFFELLVTTYSNYVKVYFDKCNK